MSTLPSGLYLIKHYRVRCYGCGTHEDFEVVYDEPDLPEGWRKATHSWIVTYGMRDRQEYFCPKCYRDGKMQKWLDSFE